MDYEATFLQLLKEFRTKSTAHGIPHVYNAKGKLKICFWSCIFLGTFVGLCFHLYYQFSLFLGYPLLVTIKVNFKPALTFPAVTVCNMNPIKKSSLVGDIMFPTIEEETEEVRENQRARRSIDLEWFCDAFLSLPQFNKEYCLFDMAESKSAGVARCNGIDFKLISFTSETEYQTVISDPWFEIFLHKKHFALDLYRDDLTWHWGEDGSVISPELSLHWKETHPNNNRDCARVEITYLDPVQHKWETVRCDETRKLTFCDRLIPGTTIVPTTQGTTFMETTRQPTTVSETTRQPTTVSETTRAATTTQGTTKQPTTTLETTTQLTTTQETTTQPTSTQETTVQSTTTLETITQPTTTQETTTKPTTALETTTQPTTDQETTTQPTTTQETTRQPTTTKETTTQTTTTLETTRQPTTIQETTRQPTSTQETTRQPTATQETTSQPTTVHGTTVNPTSIKDTTQHTTGQETTKQPTDIQESTIAQPRTKPTTFPQEPEEDKATEINPSLYSDIFEKPKPVVGSRYPERVQTRKAYQREDSVIETLANMENDVKFSMGYKAEEFILDCIFSGYDCNVSTLSHFYNPLHGNCYIFNSGWNEKEDLYISHRTGRRYGLSLVVNIDQSEYIPTIGESAGARVIIHSQNKMPFPEDEGILVRPGEMTSIGVRLIQILGAAAPYGNCFDKKDPRKDAYNETFNSTHYSKAGCFKTCYQTYVINSCGCADPNILMKGKAFEDKKVKACNSKNITEDDCKYEVTQRFISNQLQCECPNTCSDDVYIPSISTSTWPSAIHKGDILKLYEDKLSDILLSGDSDTYLQNLLKIEVYFEDFNYSTIQEQPAYSWGKFVSDLGGVFGLWLGLSIISLFEFLELGGDVIIWFIIHRTCPLKRRRRRKSFQRPNSKCSLVSDLKVSQNEKEERVDESKRPAYYPKQLLVLATKSGCPELNEDIYTHNTITKDREAIKSINRPSYYPNKLRKYDMNRQESKKSLLTNSPSSIEVDINKSPDLSNDTLETSKRPAYYANLTKKNTHGKVSY